MQNPNAASVTSVVPSRGLFGVVYDVTIKNTENKRGHEKILSLCINMWLTCNIDFMDLWESSIRQSLSRVVNMLV